MNAASWHPKSGRGSTRSRRSTKPAGCAASTGKPVNVRRSSYAISTEERELLGAAGINPDRIVVMPCGIDLLYFESDAAVTEPAFDVAVFGDFRFERNLAPARDAARWAATHHPGLRWAFVGDVESSDADALRATGATVSG